MLSCCGEFNDALATYILQNREAVLERNREIVFRNMAIAQEWIDSEPRVTWQAPKGVSVAYIQWDIPMDDEEFCIKLLKEEGVLLVPGNRFELPGAARGPRASRPSPASVRLATFVLAVAGRVDAASARWSPFHFLRNVCLNLRFRS